MDYYVCETYINFEYPDKIGLKTEARGKEGINKYTYWVTNDLL